ncbi:MAG: M3 family oligoendopeptidase [Omnitrophica WOR_2 bacterium]
MLFSTLPEDSDGFMDWSWDQMQPYYQELSGRRLDENSVSAWLHDWSELEKLVDETYSRLQLANSQDMTDAAAEQRFHTFLEKVYPSIQSANQSLKEKLLWSGLEPEGMEVPLRNMRVEAEIFQEANLPLITREHKLSAQYNRITGTQTVQWEGEEPTVLQLRARMADPDRVMREKIWRITAQRQLEDREAINQVWMQLLELRQKMAENAGFSGYREYRWKQCKRFDYTPQDCLRFHQAIEKVVVPAASRVYERQRQRFGLDSTRPWDLNQDLYPLRMPPLQAYQRIDELVNKAGEIFKHVSPDLGAYFRILQVEKLLDLENRNGKATGGFCTSFAVRKRPFIFTNAVGLASDVRTLLHEAGHAFHVFERSELPYHQQWKPGLEFAEVTSMAMELLSMPYLSASQGGFYSEEDANRARVEQLEHILVFWPYMASVDAFQHWVYENPEAAANPANCDACWKELTLRFIPGVDWRGLDAELETGWHRKQHIHRSPFYYIEYGLAQLGAVQIWANALKDQVSAVDSYRRALALGGTVPLRELYETAGAKLSFDEETLGEAVDLIEGQVSRLEEGQA